MKKSVFIFVSLALLLLAIVPAVNFIKLGSAHKLEDSNTWWNRAVLYNFDFALPVFNVCFYQLGISTVSDQVIIGKNDWLYLGDRYGNALTTARYGATASDEAVVKKISEATKAWDRWLKSKGVRQYRIMIAPNKENVYSEFLPDWMRPAAAKSPIDTLLANVSQEIYIDPRPALKSSKSKFPELPLYYKTDGHWNSLGAWISFRTFSTEVARTDSSLRWISEPQVHVSKAKIGGDLGRFLRLENILQDMVIDIPSEVPIQTERYDFNTGQRLRSTGSQLPAPGEKAILVKSKNALNNKKVLWLHDSFGYAMSPFMLATFSEILHAYPLPMTAIQFAKLVETYKPEYVFITIVERSSLTAFFTYLPPNNS